eukprot:gene19102-25706_t
MVSEAAVEAVSGAVGSVLAVGVTYPLTTNVHTKGWAAMFPGVFPCLAATAISQGVYFYLYSSIRQAVAEHKLNHANGNGGKVKSLSPDDARSVDIGILGSTIVASLAGCGNVMVTLPVWVISNQMIGLQKSDDPEMRKLSSYQVAQNLFTESGVLGFWKGLAPSLIMVLNPTLQGPKVRLGASDVFMLTALAKMGSTLMTYPLLLIKYRLQAMDKSTSKSAQYAGRPNRLNSVPFVIPMQAVDKSTSKSAQYAGRPNRLNNIPFVIPMQAVDKSTSKSAQYAGRPNRLNNIPFVIPMQAVDKSTSKSAQYSGRPAANKSTCKSAQYSGVADAIGRILQAEGFRGFFKGIQMKLVQTVLAAAMLMSIKEQLHGTTKALLMG